MNLITLTVGMLSTNCYILVDESAVIIDPGAEAGLILSEIDNHSLDVSHIIYTHGHFDHTGAAREIKRKTNAQVVMCEKDVEILHSNPLSGFGLEFDTEPAKPDLFVEEGDIISSPGIELHIFNTPGHTRGGISLSIDDMIFCGDTIFLNSVGRTDLPESSPQELMDSIREKIYKFSDDIVLLPGHGPSTTVGWEKKNNPFCPGIQ